MQTSKQANKQTNKKTNNTKTTQTNTTKLLGHFATLFRIINETGNEISKVNAPV
jgi:hypothetical protein